MAFVRRIELFKHHHHLVWEVRQFCFRLRQMSAKMWHQSRRMFVQSAMMRLRLCARSSLIKLTSTDTDTWHRHSDQHVCMVSEHLQGSTSDLSSSSTIKETGCNVRELQQMLDEL